MNTAQGTAQHTKNIPTGSDLSATLNRFVTTTSGVLALSSAGGAAVGVLTGGAKRAGEAGNVQYGGIALVEVGGTVTVDDYVKSDSVGRAVTASATDQANGAALGKAMATCTSGLVAIDLDAGLKTLVSGHETLTGAGAVSVYTEVTDWVATSDAATLADGKYVGQMKTIRAATGTSGSNTLTPATVSADASGGTSPSSLTYTDAGQASRWEWLADGWKLREIVAAGVAAVADAGTANLMHAKHDFAVDGTDTVTLPDGYYPGQKFHGCCISAANTPISIISGKFYDEDGSADGITATASAAAVGSRIHAEWTGARWNPLSVTTYVIAP